MFDLGVYCSVYGTLLFFLGLFGHIYLCDKKKCENALLVCSSLEELLLVNDMYGLKLKEEKQQICVVIFYLFAFSLFFILISDRDYIYLIYQLTILLFNGIIYV